LVQTAYARGPAETVLAGLTVIDPIVAVIIGAAFFGEYTGLTAAATAGLLASAAVGAGGVWMRARFHPTVLASRTPTADATRPTPPSSPPGRPPPRRARPPRQRAPRPPPLRPCSKEPTHEPLPRSPDRPCLDRCVRDRKPVR